MLLLTLGSPDDTSNAAVRRYLRQFLMDPLVIDINPVLRALLVHGIIAPTRAPKSAEAYKKIWTDEGSPLLVFTRNFTNKVAKEVGDRFEVKWATRYGNPNTESALKDWDVDDLYVVPLYPQYAESSTQSAINEVERSLMKLGKEPRVRYLKDFYDEPEFIRSQAQQIRRHAEQFKPDHYLLSYHGLPFHHVEKLHPNHCKPDASCCERVTEANRWCYRAQCIATSRGLVSALELRAGQSTVSFQSRLGRRPWIQPYTDIILPDLTKRGIKRLLVSCPSFVADCLETLEEIQIRLAEQFRELGGQELKLVPALNEEDFWIQDFCKMIVRPNLKWA